MKDVRLNNGVMMPAIGFGVYQIPVNETERVVGDAIEVGYRMSTRHPPISMKSKWGMPFVTAESNAKSFS